MMRRLGLGFGLWLFFALTVVMDLNGQNVLPPITNYSMTDYQAGNQNWAIDQAASGKLYFGNNKGLLEFNGANWTLYPTPNGTIVRSVKVVGDKIYAGFYMDFGYWQEDEFGQMNYHSLSAQFGTDFIQDEHFWNIMARDEWILFQSLNRIYLYNSQNETLGFAEFETGRPKMFQIEEKVILTNGKGGVSQIKSGVVKTLIDKSLLPDEPIVGVHKSGQDLLLVSESGRFYLFDGDALRLYKENLPDQFTDLSLYSSMQLKDGSLLLGCISNGFLHVDAYGNLLLHIDQEKGLMNNTVLSSFEDAQGHLWLGLDNGISNVNLNAPFHNFRDFRGKLGTVYCALNKDGLLYLGTNQGLFVRTEEETEFELIRGTNGQVWSLKNINGTLFCGHTAGTLIVEGRTARRLEGTSGTWEVKSIPGREDMLVQGTYSGLSFLQKGDQGKWHYAYGTEDFKVSSKSFVFVEANKILVNHEFNGLYLLEFDESFERVQGMSQLPKMGYDSHVLNFQDQHLYSSSEGIFSFDPDKEEFELARSIDSIFVRREDPIFGRLLTVDDGDELWGFSQRNILILRQDPFDDHSNLIEVPIPRIFRDQQGLRGFENVVQLEEEVYLIGMSDGFQVLDLGFLQGDDLSLSLVEAKKNYPEKVHLSLTREVEIPYEHNDLTFSYAVPDYDIYTEVDYRFMLDAYDEAFSEWSASPTVNYKNLPYGRYALKAQARVGNMLLSQEKAYIFTILRPWYASYLAITLYALTFLLIAIFTHRTYRRYYRKQRDRLIEENEKSFALERLEKEQAIIKLKNAQLQRDVEAKNRELAIATMSLINKNELLNGIKKDLSQVVGQDSKEQVTRLIDKNLNNKQDWDYFKEAFNNADKDFLKKIHAKHPELTPNDLKLCAYLRLNLSSKEIAPLLNISVRSVEIKRYRLRKKMDLAHEKSLVEYILEV